jgi:hypothetical protein
MAYSTLPPTLTALNSVLATPADTELASVWPAVDRQTRNWIYDFITNYFDPVTGLLKSSAIGNGTVPLGSVSGTNPQTGGQQQLVQGSVQSADLATGAVTTSKVANLAIGAAQLAVGAVGTSQLADGSVTSSKFAAASIPGSALQPGTLTSALYAANSIPQQALQAAAVANSNIAQRAVDGSQLPACSPGQLLVGGQTINGQPNCVGPLTIGGAISIDATGNVTLQSTIASTILSFARVAELGAPGASAGPSNDSHAYAGGNTGTQGYVATYTPWQGRGLGQSNGGSYGSVSWTKITDASNLLTVSDTVLTTPITVGATVYNTFQRPIYVNQKCVLLLTIKVPGHNCGSHRLRLVTLSDPTQPQNFQQYWGSSEVCIPASGSGVTGGDYMTSSVLNVLVQFAGPAGSALPYFYVDWFAQTANSTGMGLATGLGGNEYYGDVTAIRLA